MFRSLTLRTKILLLTLATVLVLAVVLSSLLISMQRKALMARIEVSQSVIQRVLAFDFGNDYGEAGFSYTSLPNGHVQRARWDTIPAIAGSETVDGVVAQTDGIASILRLDRQRGEFTCRCWSGRKTLVQRSDSGDPHVSRQATWGMSV